MPQAHPVLPGESSPLSSRGAPAIDASRDEAIRKIEGVSTEKNDKYALRSDLQKIPAGIF